MKIGEFVIIGNYGGYYDINGEFVICEEYGLTDEETDKYAIDIMNGNGYYDSNGKYRSF